MDTIKKTLKSFFYQKLMRMHSLKYFEKKRNTELVMHKKAVEEEKLEKEREDIAYVMAIKSREILEVLNKKNGWKEEKKEARKKLQANLRKMELHQKNQIRAQQKAEQAEKEIQFWSVMVEMKEKMEVMRGQRKMNRINDAAMEKEEIRNAKNMARAL